MDDDRDLRPVPGHEILFDLEQALREAARFWPRRRLHGVDNPYRPVAKRLVEHLELCGIRMFRKPPSLGHSIPAVRQLPRDAGAVRLCDLDPATHMLAIECRPCNRRGRYRLKGLIEAYGPKAGLPEVRRALVSGGECRGSVDPPRPCRARFAQLRKQGGGSDRGPGEK